MLQRILTNGVLAGLIVGVPMILMTLTLGESAPTGAVGMAIGYTTMLVALSVIFLALKRQRDVVNGGVIKFLPAFLMGLGISAVAGVLYVLAWEVSLAISGMDFGALYAEHLVEAAKARGATEAEIMAMLDLAFPKDDPRTRLLGMTPTRTQTPTSDQRSRPHHRRTPCCRRR